MTRVRMSAESGQILPLFALLAVVLVGMAALVIDVGGWYRAQRQLQTVADAAALAGARDLAMGDAVATANSYVHQNLSVNRSAEFADPTPCAGLVEATASCAIETDAASFEPSSPCSDADGTCIRVEVRQRPAGFFVPALSKVIGTVTVTASAIAGLTAVGGAVGGLPATFASSSWEPGESISWPFGSSPAPGSFNLVVWPGYGGSVPDLITAFSCTRTYSWPGLVPGPLPAGCDQTAACANTHLADSNTGNSIQNKNVRSALDSLSGKLVLVPVYSSASGTGRNAQYAVAGFAAILLDDPDVVEVGKAYNLVGTFEKFVAPGGFAGACSSSGSNYGVTTVSLLG